VLTRRHAPAPASVQAQAQAAAHRKPARKVTLGLASHTRRIRRGRKLQSDSHAMPLVEIRKKLVEKGVIKETSKAPEAVLRQLYIDTVSITEPVL